MNKSKQFQALDRERAKERKILNMYEVTCISETILHDTKSFRAKLGENLKKCFYAIRTQFLNKVIYFIWQSMRVCILLEKILEVLC